MAAGMSGTGVLVGVKGDGLKIALAVAVGVRGISVMSGASAGMDAVVGDSGK